MLDDKGIVIKGLMDKKRKSSIDLSFIITYSYKVRVSSPNERKRDNGCRSRKRSKNVLLHAVEI
jgi:hypothetical protein